MSKSKQFIKLAFDRGYRVLEDGTVKNPRGKTLKAGPITNKRGYSIHDIGLQGPDKKHGHCPVHRLVAYQKYGEDSFEEGIHVRHLDGNSLNNRWENIALGTCSENSLDRPVEVRRTMAARASQKYSEEFIKKIREEHKNGASYSMIKSRFGVPFPTLSMYLSRKSKKNSYLYPLEDHGLKPADLIAASETLED